MYSEHFGAVAIVTTGESIQRDPKLVVSVESPARVSRPTMTEQIQWVMLDRQIRLLAQRMQVEQPRLY
jgi:hypothetical protein